MRIQLASDLHLEHLTSRFPGEPLIRPVPAAKVLVLAGDIGRVKDVVRVFGDWPVPVLYVLGNHEFYSERVDAVRDQARQLTAGTPIRYLEREAFQLDGVRFLGTTLWTDYRYPDGCSQAELMRAAEQSIWDHRAIAFCQGTAFGAAQALAEHEASRHWLRTELARPFQGRTVVITHHAPHPRSVHPRFDGSLVNAAFVSDLSKLMPQADLWLHGHVHDCFDYRVDGCRVVANPRGYAENRRSAAHVDELVFENDEFRSDLLIDTDALE
ncbi:metallophosphoesterase family protein [Derxia lacustris]|uniref:metallophosphoesterase family protein n=1 Tax=Derxia lacustris TaxID=764842 RepID=UPI000A16F0AF|nr:metallophosphoesterase [Derxia lacustris]